MLHVHDNCEIAGKIKLQRRVTFDIETGPVDDLSSVIAPYPECPLFDPETVKFGGTKSDVLRAEKITKCRAEHYRKYEENKREYEEKSVSDAALNPITGKVLAIGYRCGDESNIHLGPEELLIEQHWRIYEMACRSGCVLDGWSIKQFDLPFMRRRSWLHDVVIPNGIFKREGRIASETYHDLQIEFGCGGDKFTKLDVASSFFRVGRKNGNGGEFAELLKTNREMAVLYLDNDLKLTHLCGVKMQLS